MYRSNSGFLRSVVLCLGFAHSVFLPSAVKANGLEGNYVTTAEGGSMVDIYTLPQKFQTILRVEGNDIYAVEYYITTNDEAEALGISLKQWVDKSSGVEQFFNAWYGDEELSKKLSEKYQIFADESGLLGVSEPCTNNQGVEPNGALCLNQGSNGGGFIYSGWSGNLPSASNRPDTDIGSNNGLIYYWNGQDYYTNGGKIVNRIQAFGGCAVNTIDEEVPSDKLVGAKVGGTEGATFCAYKDKVVSSELYAPVFEGGILKVVGNNDQEFVQKFYIAEEGGEINNNGKNVTFSGEFTDHIPSPTRGNLTFSGSAITTLSGTNDYDGETIVKQGTLRITNRMGLGSAKGGTTVQKDAKLIFNLNGVDNKSRATILEPIVVSGGVLSFDGQHLILGADASLELIGDSTINVTEDSKDVYIFVRDGIYGEGNLIKDGKGTLLLNAPSSGDSEPSQQRYKGDTLIRKGMLTIDNNTSLPSTTNVEINKGATLRILSTINSVQSLSGSGDLVLRDLDAALIAAGSNGQSFSGEISGAGSFTKTGSADFLVSGSNAFRQSGDTRIKGGILNLENTTQEIQSLVIDGPGKVLGGDLVAAALDNSGEISINSLAGTSADNTFVNVYGSIKITSNANIHFKGGNDTFLTNANVSGSGIIDGGAGVIDTIKFGTARTCDLEDLDDPCKDVPSFKAAKIDNFEFAEQVSGDWDYDGNYKEAGVETMTLKGGRMLILDNEHATFKNFVMDGKDAQLVASLESKNSAPLVADSFDYKAGSLAIMASDQTNPEGTYMVIDAPAASQGEMNQLAANTMLFYDENTKSGSFSGIGIANGIEESAIYDVYLKEGSLQLVVDKKSAPEVIVDLDCSDPDQYLAAICEPDSPGKDIVDEILDDILDDIDLPIISEQTLAKLFISGLAPRNIDGPGRGMATYNNLLADTLFERLPLRQFDPVVIEETVVEEEEVIEEDPAPPVRGLWSKSGEVSDQDAQQALDNAIAQNTDVVVEESTMVERLEAAGFVEDPSLTAQYARRDGVRAWFRAFGGDDRDSSSDNFHNPYYVNSGGGVLGVDVSVSESFQVGAFVNYGTINLTQQGALAGGGSWNPDGWGGGVRADYWTDNFYVQGLFSATGFSGNQKRDIVEITSQLGDETASGSKSATSYGLAFRVGTPFEAGDFMIEPQFTSTWSFNNENRFTESGAGDLNLTYKERSTTYLQTDLAIKFAYPIKTGDTTELVPSLRVGWLGDWSGSLSNQTIGYRFTDDTVNIDSINEDTNGVLVEGGLDYTIANLNSSSYKVYVRGGIEAWGGTRGTDYRASGGFEWQF